MNTTLESGVALAKDVVEASKGIDTKSKTVMVAPPFVYLPAIKEVVKGTNVLLGAQNMSTDEKGAHTGEVSIHMLKDLGVDVVILGHSERRHVYGETNEMINKKAKLAIAQGMDIILCIGELLEEREAGKAEAVCKEQVVKGLAGVSKADMSKVTIAYEPVWAIGTGKVASPEDAEAIHAYTRKVIADLYDGDVAGDTVIQYGGSVKPDNVKGLMAKENIDGALVGGAALDIGSFGPIINF